MEHIIEGNGKPWTGDMSTIVSGMSVLFHRWKLIKVYLGGMRKVSEL